jgi:hemolysin activation/secretion protein
MSPTSRSCLKPSLILCAIALSFATVAAPQPPTAGQVQQTLPPAPRPIPVTPAQPMVQPAPAPGAIDAGGPRFTVSAFQFSGNSVVKSEELAAQISDLLGRPITATDLGAAAQKLTRYYQRKGYPLASVNLPAQKVDGGTVRFEVLEGRLGEVTVEGNKTYTREGILMQLSDLPRGQPLTGQDLEQELLLLNDLPGLEVRGLIVPGKKYGESDLVVKVEEQPRNFTVSFDDHGRDSIGRMRGTVEGRFNSLIGWGDELTFTLLQSEDALLNYGRFGYSVPVDDEGARVGISYYETDFSVDDPNFVLVDIAGRSSGLRIGYSKPLVRTRARSMTFDVGVQRLETETTSIGFPVAGGGITLLELGLYSSGQSGATTWTSAYSFAGNFSYNDGISEKDQVGRLRADFTTSSPLGGGWVGATRLSVQYGIGSVVDLQKFTVGGPYSVRGYEPSAARGDSGFDGSFEMLHPIGGGALHAVFAVFADVGYVSSHASSNATDQDGPWLGAVGLGLRLQASRVVSLSLDYATPIGGTRPQDANQDHLWGKVAFSF